MWYHIQERIFQNSEPMREKQISYAALPQKGRFRMKYLVVLLDGAADVHVPVLGDKTPFEVAHKPTIDALAKKALVGTVCNVPEGMVPESDTANLAVMSYDPRKYSKGRSPLEAVSMGLDMQENETAFRCNLVTLSDSGLDDTYEAKSMVDHSSGEITTQEADQLIAAIQEAFGNDERHFYTGISYRHCLLWKDAPQQEEDFCRPHDILGKCIREYLPKEPFLSLMRDSYDVLCEHPVNIARMERGLRPANSLWLWSPGKKPALPSFEEKWGLKASVVAAVDLIKGIGICAGMNAVEVEGATGNIHTNFKGKADAAIQEFKNGSDYVYIHVEAPDECGHCGEPENKVHSIELIDEKIVRPLYDYLVSTGEDFKIMALPDHPTPVALRTHTSNAVPFMIYHHSAPVHGVDSLTEANAAATGLYLEKGEDLMDYFVK